MIERNDHVRVVSTKETICGRFDGMDYEFRPNEPVDIHHVAAAHIFGFGREDKSQALARLGWATSSEHMPKAIERLRHVRFSEAPALVEAPVAELVDASAGERLPERTLGSRPLAQGGNAGTPTSGGVPAEPRKRT